MNMPREEAQQRVARARAHMQESGVDGLVVTDAVSFQYFTGQKIGRESIGRPSAFILPLQGEPAVVDWSGPGTFARLYRRPYPTWVEDRRIYPESPFTIEQRVDWGIQDVLRERGLASGRIAIELSNEPRLGLGIYDFQRLQEDLPHVQWVDSTAIVMSGRMVKSEWEIEQLKTACRLGAEAWQRCFNDLQPGITQAQVQKKVLSYYAEAGADIDSPPPLVLGATGEKGMFQKGDILYMDGGCTYNGYRMDFTRRAVFGKASERQRAEHDGMWEIVFKLIERMRPGVTSVEIFEYSQSLLAETSWTNYSDHPSKRIGHGIGLVNEPPYLNAFDPHVLQAGMSLTPEPKIETVEGLLNAEEHIIVRASGCEVISDHMPWALHEVL